MIIYLTRLPALRLFAWLTTVSLQALFFTSVLAAVPAVGISVWFTGQGQNRYSPGDCLAQSQRLPMMAREAHCGPVVQRAR